MSYFNGLYVSHKAVAKQLLKQLLTQFRADGLLHFLDIEALTENSTCSSRYKQLEMPFIEPLKKNLICSSINLTGFGQFLYKGPNDTVYYRGEIPGYSALGIMDFRFRRYKVCCFPTVLKDPLRRVCTEKSPVSLNYLEEIENQILAEL
jgi:hypothetical protein